MSAMPNTVLSVHHRERLKRLIEEDKRRLHGDIVVSRFKHIKEGMPTRLLGRYQQHMDPAIREDQGEIAQRLRKHQAALQRGEPPPVERSERVKLEKQVRSDREWLKSQMCRKKLFHVKDSDPDFKKAVKACMREQTPEFNQVAARYKNAMRRLDTETPDASSLERLRPK